LHCDQLRKHMLAVETSRSVRDDGGGEAPIEYEARRLGHWFVHYNAGALKSDTFRELGKQVSDSSSIE